MTQFSVLNIVIESPGPRYLRVRTHISYANVLEQATIFLVEIW